MHSLFTLNLDLERAGKVICAQSLPFDTARETLLLLSPVGTQCCYMKNAALFLISHFNLIILESDTWLAYANEAGVNPEEGVADFIRQFNAALPEPVRVDALVAIAPQRLWHSWQPTKVLVAPCYCLMARTFSKTTG